MMPMKQHKVPCKQCPFRKDSVRGWLGGYSPYEFINHPFGNENVKCHMAADATAAKYIDKPGSKQVMEQEIKQGPYCAGNLIYMKQQCKIPIIPEIAFLVEKMEPNKEIFTWPQEFIDHHDLKKTQREKEKVDD